MSIARKNPAKLTARDVFEYLLTAPVDAEVQNYAKVAIAALDKRNAKRAETPTKTQKENEPLKAEIISLLTEKPQTAAELAVALSITTQKASALAVQLVKEGKLAQGERAIKGKGKVKEYSLTAETAEDAE